MAQAGLDAVCAQLRGSRRAINRLSVAARRITVASSGTPASVALAASSLQVLAGALIVWFGIVLLSASLA